MERIDVGVIGAGPVGSTAALALARQGARVVAFETREGPTRHARAIGVHPTALEALAPLGVVEELREAGQHVRRGRAFRASDGRRVELGTLDFAACPPPYRFVLTVPQWATERILAERLDELAPGAVRWGHRVRALRQDADGVELEVDGPGGTYSCRARAVIACDGRDGATRDRLGIPVEAHVYRDTFVMADVAPAAGRGATDDPVGQADSGASPASGASTDAFLDRDEAGILLTPSGVVEAFPLPGGVRRWVVATGHRMDAPTPDAVVREIARHSGVTIDPGRVGMISAFGVERRLADRFVAGRVVLCGDAAHVCSPIGGQGMNLGWLDVVTLVRPLLSGDADALGTWERTRRRAAIRAIRRAEFNMALGRTWAWPGLQDAAVRLALQRPFADVLARRFTMRGLAGPDATLR